MSRLRATGHTSVLVGTLGFLRKIPMRVGIDPLPLQALSCSETMRTIIEELRKPVVFQISAGERTPFPDSSFDLVLCCNVLDHVQDPAVVLKEVSRVLQPLSDARRGKFGAQFSAHLNQSRSYSVVVVHCL